MTLNSSCSLGLQKTQATTHVCYKLCEANLQMFSVSKSNLLPFTTNSFHMDFLSDINIDQFSVLKVISKCKKLGDSKATVCMSMYVACVCECLCFYVRDGRR